MEALGASQALALAVRASLAEECLQVSVGDEVRGVWGVWGMETAFLGYSRPKGMEECVRGGGGF